MIHAIYSVCSVKKQTTTHQKKKAPKALAMKDKLSKLIPRKKPSLKGSGKKAFWIWVTYQAIKGTLTTSLIWIPLLYAWLNS